MKPILTHPSWWTCERGAHNIAMAVTKAEVEVDYIVALARGGLVPGVCLSHILKVPMISCNYSSRKGNGDDKNHANVLPEIPQNGITRSTILIIDDIVDKGYTMEEVCNHYEPSCKVWSAALYTKTDAAHKPNFFWQEIPDDSPWIIFPWEV
jgi:uncharacterized protein